MRQMLRGFSEPFGRDPWLSLTDGAEGTHQDTRLVPRGQRRGTSYSLMPFAGFGRRDADFGDPFSAMDRMMSTMRNSMLEMQRKFDDLSFHPDAHTFSSSSVMTYSKVGDEPPKVFQASTQTRTAPGGVKETKKALKDSESGLEKMAIGHHLHDRAHVIQKSKNTKTGDEEMNQEFINLDESDAQTFDEEWQKEVMKFRPSRARSALEAPKHKSIHHMPKEDGARREKPRAITGPRDSLENLGVKGTHVPTKSSRK
ncbi:PREDICTED: myeloid leukemia factor 1 [Acanthisitta chloris]|uniref:myeloid leukemia factor 1 n=1 Tax=Acanthisitta chloris TaxID=57068 RepID=UPI0004F0D602|nr:PREDICTED: myeloid leukemia factor 1 [Acanthisitta chloris]